MSTSTRHLWITGDRAVARLALAATHAPDAVVASAHRRLRGPYTGVDAVLRAVLPDAGRRWPELVEAHRVELLHGMPDLAEVIGPPPVMMSNSTPFAQRTRFYQLRMLRGVNHGIVTFLRSYATARTEAGDGPLTLFFDDVQHADDTTQELVALLVRRCDPAVLRVLVGTGAGDLLPELPDMLASHAERLTAPAVPASAETRTADALVAAFVASEGTSDDPAEIAAYQSADPAVVARLHDERADELDTRPGMWNPVGAVPYHREHGQDPAGAGCEALRQAMQFCVECGFSAAILEYTMRGRRLTDPAEAPLTYCDFSVQAIYSLIDLNRLTESLEICEELRRRYTRPKLHMVIAYTMAMIYTRFIVPRDHELALAWQNTAIALAGLLTEPDERRVQIGLQDNGLALIQMHRREFDHALALVQSGMDRLDRELDADDWILHRAQLLYNRARLLVVMKRQDDAFADLTRLIELDPYFTEYLTERAKISRRRGDFAAALADYDRAIELSPPFWENFYTRATARLEAGDTAGALADFDLVLDMEPTEVDSRVSRAETHLSLGDFESAEQDVRLGLALSPDEPRLLCMLGMIELERDELVRALDLLDAALTVDPDYPAALVNRAVAEYRLSRASDAVADLTKVLDLVGADPDVLLNRGLAYQADGRSDLALADFTSALALPDADVAELRYLRGCCLLAAGQRDQGRADLLACAELGEHESDVDELLAGTARVGVGVTDG
ncbi:MAG TPA: tetratricopeptide repeat protein [Pseudonocardiaceae bacterium]